MHTNSQLILVQEPQILDDQSRLNLLFINLILTHVFIFPKLDSPADAAAGSLEDVSPKIPDVRAALKANTLSLLTRLITYWCMR